jgi:Flp pilus assembly protein TadG
MGASILGSGGDACLRRRGVTMFYIIACLVALMGFVSFAVDLGRVETAKTELRRAADAAARAGLAYISQGSSSVQTAAINMAANEKCDGSTVVLASSNVTLGIWNTSTKTFSTSGSADNVTKFQAVQVTASRTKAGGNAIPLLFGMVLGAKSCDVTASSVAALMATQSTTQFISAQSDIWLAGEAKGTLGSVADGGYSSASHPYKNDIAGDPSIAYGQAGGPGSSVGSKVSATDYNNQQVYNSILQFNLTVTPGSVIQISNVSGQASNEGEFTGGSGNTYADGTGNGSIWSLSDDGANPSLAQGTATTSGSEHGISNIITPINSMVGVFLDANAADTASDSNYSTTPSGLDFSTQSARDYTTLEPKLAQSFYTGTGQTSGGTQQTIVVPPHATRLFLGTMDGHEWSNNVGGFTATITQYTIEIVH